MPEFAGQRAKAHDCSIESALAALTLPSYGDLKAQIQTYLLKQNADMGTHNNVYKILRANADNDVFTISLGPRFDKGPDDSHFYLESGSRLSFGITVRGSNAGCSLLEYRFQLSLPDSHTPQFYRFDLNDKAHETPLHEPRCHLHPGTDKVRLPCPVFTPLEILDRIFLVIDPQTAAALATPPSDPAKPASRPSQEANH